MKLYIWQDTPNTKWYIHYDFDHPLGKQLRGSTNDILTRTTLACEGIDQTATFRLNPRTCCGEIFTRMTLYQFLLEPDTREGSKEKCILHSTGAWLVQHPRLTTAKIESIM